MSYEIVRKTAKELINAAEPFLSDEIVDETMGTIPLMNRLAAAIEKMEAILKEENRCLHHTGG